MVFYDQNVSPELERRIRNFLDDDLPHRAIKSLAVELAACLEAPLADVVTVLDSLEKRKIYQYSRFETAITRVSKGSEFKELVADGQNRPRSAYGRVLVELRKLAVGGVCRHKNPAAYLSERISGLTNAGAEEVLCRLHEAAVITVFKRGSGEAEILVGDQTEAIDLEVQELIDDEPGDGVSAGSIYALLERLLISCEATSEALDESRKSAEDDANLAATRAERITELEAEFKRLRTENQDLTQGQYPSNRLRKLARKAGLLE